jgi:RHS repeat-associated protein
VRFWFAFPPTNAFLEPVRIALAILILLAGIGEAFAHIPQSNSAANIQLRSEFTDYRQYDYAPSSRRLTVERLNIPGVSTRWTNVFEYDAGIAGKDGVLTKIAESNTGGSSWTATMDLFSRIERETNNVVRRLAHGRLNSFPNFAAASVKLDGRSLPVTLLQTEDPQWPTQWRSMIEVRPGPHTLEAVAIHPSGHYQTNKSVTFTNNAIDQTTVSYFAEGQINLRIWKNSLGQTNRIQTFTWDAKGRLLRMSEIDSSNNGSNWEAVYDPLGRKIRTKTIVVTNGIALNSQPSTINQFYDPEHRFLELGVNVDGKTTWKLMGPDGNGRYGGLNGIGGLDGVIDDITIFHPVISDARGNLLASYDPVAQQVKWTAARPTGYGAIPEHRPVALVNNAGVVQASAWQGRWPEITGVYWKGSRYYDPQGGYFLSHDPVHDPNNPSGYTYAGGDPINFTDPTGELGVRSLNWGTGINLNSNLSFAEQLHAYRLGGAEWIEPMFTIPTIKTVDFAWNLLVSTLFTPDVPNRQGFRDVALEYAGDPTQRAFGMERDLGARTLAADLSDPLQDMMRARVALQSGSTTPLVQARSQPKPPTNPTVYSVAFEMQLAPPHQGLRQTHHFQLANQALQAERAANPALAQLVPAPVGWGRPPTGWTWQHATIQQGGGRQGVMQLVPREQHTPGSPFWYVLHPLPGGAGGYAEWAVPAGAPAR